MRASVPLPGLGAGAPQAGCQATGEPGEPAGPGLGSGPDLESPSYRHAYGRINGLVVVGEGLADRHFRRLARAIPEDAALLRRLAAMEGRHARDFVG